MCVPKVVNTETAPGDVPPTRHLPAISACENEKRIAIGAEDDASSHRLCSLMGCIVRLLELPGLSNLPKDDCATTTLISTLCSCTQKSMEIGKDCKTQKDVKAGKKKMPAGIKTLP